VFISCYALCFFKEWEEGGLVLVVQICIANCFGLLTSSSFQVLSPSLCFALALRASLCESIFLFSFHADGGGKERSRRRSKQNFNLQTHVPRILIPPLPPTQSAPFCFCFVGFFFGYDFLQKVLGRRNWLRIFAFRCWTWIAFGICS